MWNAFPLSTCLYVFQHEQDNAEHWAATAYVEDAGGLLKIQSFICLTYVHEAADYDMLLDAVRHFADEQSRREGKQGCVIRFQCTGLVLHPDEISFPSLSMEDGPAYADAVFTEERMLAG